MDSARPKGGKPASFIKLPAARRAVAAADDGKPAPGAKLRRAPVRADILDQQLPQQLLQQLAKLEQEDQALQEEIEQLAGVRQQANDGAGTATPRDRLADLRQKRDAQRDAQQQLQHKLQKVQEHLHILQKLLEEQLRKKTSPGEFSELQVQLRHLLMQKLALQQQDLLAAVAPAGAEANQASTQKRKEKAKRATIDVPLAAFATPGERCMWPALELAHTFLYARLLDPDAIALLAARLHQYAQASASHATEVAMLRRMTAPQDASAARAAVHDLLARGVKLPAPDAAAPGHAALQGVLDEMALLLKVVADHAAGADVFCEIRARTRQPAIPGPGASPATALLEKLEAIDAAGNQDQADALQAFLLAYSGRERKLPAFGVAMPAGVRRAQDMLAMISDADELLQVVIDRHPRGSAVFRDWQQLVPESGAPFTLATNADLLDRLCAEDDVGQQDVEAARNFLADFVSVAAMLQSWSGETLPADARDAQEMLRLVREWETAGN